MPRRPASPCPRPRCPHASPCPVHVPAARREVDAARGSAAARGYDRKWRRNSARFLAAHPVCRDCGGRSEQADHWPLSRRQLVAAGVEHPDAWERLVPRCTSCHSSRTAREHSGWGSSASLSGG